MLQLYCTVYYIFICNVHSMTKKKIKIKKNQQKYEIKLYI